MEAQAGKTLLKSLRDNTNYVVLNFPPTIPVDPAGDYSYQVPTKPCESLRKQGVLLSNT